MDYILSGEKTWEVRSTMTKVRGKILLIKSGTGKIYGSAELVDSFPISKELFTCSFHKHRIPIDKFDDISYKIPHVWVLTKVQCYSEPIPYTHPQGAVIWVNIKNM